jgi:hypothetical protein
MTFSAAGPTTKDVLKQGHPEQYTVVKGDTLWGIAETFLEAPWQWPEIWQVNDQIKNPHLIYPGDVIRLIYVNGKPRLTMDRQSDRHANTNGADGDIERTQLADGTVKLSPRVRVSDLDSVIPAIPLDAVQSFLLNNRVIAKGVLEAAPYVIAGNEEHISMGAGDKFYARGKFPEGHSAYGIYRQGEVLVDPDTKEFLGVMAEEMGLAKSLDQEKDVNTLRLIRTRQEVNVGDRLLPTEEGKVDSVFYPKSPSVEIKGKIIQVFGGVRNVSQYNVVAINRGERDKLAVGDVLAIYRKGEQVRDNNTRELVQLPSERSGVLIVFKVFEKVSFGLILKAETTLKVLDEVKNP